MHGVLTVQTAVRLGTLASAASRYARVARAEDYGATVTYGTARAITTEDGALLGATTDIRDGYLWVTTDQGFEAFWPVSDILVELQHGLFVIDAYNF
jgi:hypothetical protein